MNDLVVFPQTVWILVLDKTFGPSWQKWVGSGVSSDGIYG